ncbi:MAG: hypothetical protein JWM05_917 [Acidimicrobiales bacterium]|nr:hypothetical protein [Acidimicrobiales bacterium]
MSGARYPDLQVLALGGLVGCAGPATTMHHAMGQPIAVIEKPSSNRGVVRYETNRALTGMGHERYSSAEDAWGPRPPDELARRLFARGGIERVHINSNVITIDLSRGYDVSGIKEIIEGLYTFYPPGAEAPAAADAVAAASESSEVAEATAAQAPTDATGGPAPEMATDTSDQVDAAGPPVAAEAAAAEEPAADEPAADEPAAETVAEASDPAHVSPVEAESPTA